VELFARPGGWHCRRTYCPSFNSISVYHRRSFDNNVWNPTWFLHPIEGVNVEMSKLRAYCAAAWSILRSDINALRWGVFPKVYRYRLFYCDPERIAETTRYLTPIPGSYLVDGSDLPSRNLAPALERFVSAGNWDLETAPVEDLTIIRRALRRYKEGMSWEDVGEYDFMLRGIELQGSRDGCRNLDDVKRRCEGIDEIEKYVAIEGRLKSPREVSRFNFRGKGAIGVGIGRDGQLIFLRDGAHRLAIARLHNLESVPVCILLVHPEAIKKQCVMANISTVPLTREP
jgi:hypothetical protein